jgi:hypothetical protein
VPHAGRPKIAPRVDHLKEAPGESGDACQALGKVDSEPSLGVREIVFLQGSSGRSR